MLQIHIHEQGRDPRTTQRAVNFRSFFRHACRKVPMHLHNLATEHIEFNELRNFLPPENVYCKVIGLEPVYFHGRITEMFRVPAYTFFWKNTQNAIGTACLPLHCCAYGYSAKLGRAVVPLLTTLTAAHIGQDNVVWCSQARTWSWKHVPLPHMRNDVNDLPVVVWDDLQPPRFLAACWHGIRPLWCFCCQVWFSNYVRFAEHVCFAEQNLGPHYCGSSERIAITPVFETQPHDADMVMCEACMMLFCHIHCLQKHQQICTRNPLIGAMIGWRSSYGLITPARTAQPRFYQSFLITGTPFRKLRLGCEHCVWKFYPCGHWIRADKHIKKWWVALGWVNWTVSLVIRHYCAGKHMLAASRSLREQAKYRISRDVKSNIFIFM